MIRKNTNGDISDDKFEAVLKPFLDDYDNFIYSYVMPEIIAYYIANSFNRNSMYSGTFDQHYNSAKDMLNLFNEDYETVKAEVFKLLKIKYATDWYGFNFVHVYRKMQNFNNPNEIPKEMLFFTYDEFQQFLSVEEDIKFRCGFQLLYYCGLRIGELKGLTWKDIDFENKTVSINKQITKQSSRENWRFVLPKTKKSNRVLPLTKVLLNDLKTLRESDKEILFGFNDKFFVVGDIAPASNNRFSDRKNKNCEKAGVKQIRLHDFRHSCASLLIYKGASINMVSKFLGHSKIEETLNTYTHLYSNALSDITNLIDEMNESQDLS